MLVLVKSEYNVISHLFFIFCLLMSLVSTSDIVCVFIMHIVELICLPSVFLCQVLVSVMFIFKVRCFSLCLVQYFTSSICSFCVPVLITYSNLMCSYCLALFRFVSLA